MNIFEIPVHPAAEVFPMLDADELAELANDIAQNGLRSPLIVSGANGDMVLIDGRNRREACRLVKVEPTYQQLEGDPVAYILSANINRRHLTKGQRAVAIARLTPKQQGKKRTSSVSDDVSSTRIKQARMVLEFCPDMVDGVMSGATSLDKAYATAQERKLAAASDEARLERIRKAQPQLADLVVEERLTLNAAEQQIKDLEQKERARVNAYNLALKQLVDAADYIQSDTEASRLAAFLSEEAVIVNVNGQDAKHVARKLRNFYRQLAKVIGT